MAKKKNIGNEEDLEDAINRISSDQPFREQSELGEVFDNIDNDKVTTEGMSNIDFNARLKDHEANMCMIFDELKAKGILPRDANLTRMKKRLSVSLGGQGRKEKVAIASASRGADLDGKSGGFFRGLFTRRGE